MRTLRGVRHALAARVTLFALSSLALYPAALASQAPPSRSTEWDVTVARGEPRAIDFTVDEGTWMTVDVTPAGDRLVFDLLGCIYAVPATGGEATLLTRDPGVSLNFQPALSPDGAQIAFISDRGGQNNLWVMRSDGSDPRIVEQNLKVRHSLPVWTPDGRFIVARRVALDDRRRSEVWLYSSDGGRGVALTKPAEHPEASEPSVSGDGRYLYFTIEVPGVDDPAKGRTQLRRLDLRTGDVLRITEGSERGPGGDSRLSSGGGFAPRVSPDGRWLAFGRRLASGTISFKGRELGPRTALWLRDLATGQERLLVDPTERDLQENGSDWTGRLPGYAWSRDGQQIYIATGGRLRRVDVASGRIDVVPFRARVERRISAQAYAPVRIDDADDFEVRFLRWPAVAADGRRAAFQAVGRVWIMDLPEGRPRQAVAPTFERHQYAPAFSPDGQWLAFTSWTDDERGHVWKVPAAGGAAVQLTREAGEYLNPVWSPDGRTVVVSRGSGASLRGQMLVENAWYDLCAVPAEGGSVRTITSVSPPTGRVSHRRFSVQPSFGPDGRVYYPEVVTGPDNTSRTEVRSIGVDGQDRRTHVTVPAADEAVVSPDGRWLAFEEGDNVYLVALPMHGVGGTPVHLTREERPVWPIRALTTRGGNYPRFVSNERLTFGSAREIVDYDLRTGRATTHRVQLRVPRPRAEGTLVLRNARLITMEGDRIIERGDVAIRSGRIEAVDRAGRLTVPPGARVLDLAGATVIPGLVDMHTHNHRSPSGILPQRDYEMAAVLAYGVTTTLDNSMWSQNIFPQAEMVEAGEIVGPRVFSTGDPLYAGDHARQNELNSLERTRDEIRRLKSYGAVSLKQYQQPERRQRQWVSQVAREEGLMVTAEGGDLLYVVSMLMDGQTGWEHPIPQVPLYADATTFLGLANGFYSSTLGVAGPGPWNDQYWTQQRDLWMDAKLRRFAPWRKLEAHTRRRDLRPATDYTYPLLAQGVADVVAAGGHGAIGAHGQQHGIASHWEIWMLASAMPPLEALRIATLHGATMLGAQADIGSITPGKLADLVVLDGNPLSNIQDTAKIRYVLKGGRVHDGDTLDEVWPRSRPFGRFFWEMDAARPVDVKVVR